MSIINYKLELYEGPLDLLLALIHKNKMNIEDIQISILCDQYMEYISQAEFLDIELSSDFLLMASELMLIKSKMLLPRIEEEEEDPRAALAAAVLEYQRAKEASVFLRSMFDEYGARMIKDTDEISIDKSYVCDHDVLILSKAFHKVISEVRVTDDEAKEKFKPLLAKKTVSVASVVENLARRLSVYGKVRLYSFFRSAETKTELVTMFLAMLELLKSGILVLEEENLNHNGVIDTSSEVSVSLEENADISELTQIIKED